jgi:hypothetical protein
MKRLVSTGTAIVLATFALDSSQALACDWGCGSCSGYGYYGAPAPAYYAASTYYGAGYGYAPPLYSPAPAYYAAPYYAIPSYYGTNPYYEYLDPYSGQIDGDGYGYGYGYGYGNGNGYGYGDGYPYAQPYNGPRGYVARPGGAVAAYAPGVNRAVLTRPGISGGSRAAPIRAVGRVPGPMPGQMPGRIAGQVPGQIPGQLGQTPGQTPSKSLWLKQLPRPATAPRAVPAEPNKSQLSNRALIAMPARQGAPIPLAQYAKPNGDRAVQKAPIIAGGPHAASIHIPGRVPSQMIGQIPGQIPGKIPGKIPGQVSGQGLWQKQPPRPANAPRAVIAEPNTPQSKHKALVAMPVRQGATPPAQFLPKIPGARVETRLTIR